MPYDIVRRDSKFCVVKVGEEDDPIGCHDTRQEAQDQIAAIEANESSLYSELWDIVEKVVDERE